MALAARLQGRSSRVFVVLGDGELDEGSNWEAALCAAKHKLDRLTAVIDRNKLQSYGSTEEILPLEPLAEKWRSFGFAVQEADGHDINGLQKAFAALPYEKGQPNVLICHTVKGRGFPAAENDPAWHHKARVSAGEIAELRRAIEQT